MKKSNKTLFGPTLTILAGVVVLAFFVSLPGFASAGKGNLTLVNCTGSGTDRVLIQNAINNASNGDTLMLAGTCQLDGTQVFITKSNLTITGAGAAGNWSTVLKGIAGGGGAPVRDGSFPNFILFNRGFQIGNTSGNSQVQNVRIENIKFSTLHRGVIVSPQIGGNTALCSGTSAGSGSATSITVENNWFDNDDRAAQVFGTANHVTFQNNLVTNATANSVDFLIEGQIINCVNGTGSVFPIGIPENSATVGNSISGGNEFIPILINNTDKATVTNNSVSALGITLGMIVISEASNSHVSNNQINGGGISPGILATDFNSAVSGFPLNSSNVQISNNKITNGAPGIAVDSDTTGYSVINNVFDTDPIADILLCGTVVNSVCNGGAPPSFENKVVTTNFSTTVSDDGNNNELLGTQNLINNPNVPPGVKSKLIGGAVGRPQQ